MIDQASLYDIILTQIENNLTPHGYKRGGKSALFYRYSSGKQIKAFLRSPYAQRIDSLCRGRDYWWQLTEEFMREYSPEEYYARFIRADIEKSVVWLQECALRQEQFFHFS